MQRFSSQVLLNPTQPRKHVWSGWHSDDDYNRIPGGCEPQAEVVVEDQDELWAFRRTGSRRPTINTFKRRSIQTVEQSYPIVRCL